MFSLFYLTAYVEVLEVIYLR